MIEVRGGCQCKAVRFSARLPDPPVPAIDCNCSICLMTGFLHVIVPRADFTMESGEDVLASYRFGTGFAEHLFCSKCGVKSFYQPRSHPDSWSVNAHCLDEHPELVVDWFDGENWEQAAAQLDAQERRS
jgi:hypothetical protein